MAVHATPKSMDESIDARSIMTLVVSYVFFGIGFWITIQLATFNFYRSGSQLGWLFLGWNPADLLWMHTLKYGLRLYVTLVPLLTIMGISIGVYAWFLEAKVRVWMTLLKTTGLSLAFALPLIVLLAFLSGILGFIQFPPVFTIFQLLPDYDWILLYDFICVFDSHSGIQFPNAIVYRQ